MMQKSKIVLTGATRWAQLAFRSVREDGSDGLKESARTFYTGLWRAYGLVSNYGTPIYERDWDVLIVLDACRADLMAEVAPAYDFLSTGVTSSVGSASPEWMEKNFSSEYSDEMARTAYVTANPYSETKVDEDDFQVVDEVWKYGWDDDLGTVPPQPVTDRAIAVHRTRAPERLIVHYMQPHHPFIPNPLDEGVPKDLENTEWGELNSVWNKLQRGELTRAEVWRAYRDNLEYVLDHVRLLLDNVDADTAVITSDHGNALGEHGMYGHLLYAPVEALKQVPWCVTTATDTGTYGTKTREEVTVGDEGARRAGKDVEGKLRDLGYL